MSNKPDIEDIVTACTAIRAEMIRTSGIHAAIAASWDGDANKFRRVGEHDAAISAEQRAQEARSMALNLITMADAFARALGIAPPRQRTGEWRPPTPEETTAALAETAKLDRGEVAAGNADEEPKR